MKVFQNPHFKVETYDFKQDNLLGSQQRKTLDNNQRNSNLLTPEYAKLQKEERFTFNAAPFMDNRPSVVNNNSNINASSNFQMPEKFKDLEIYQTDSRPYNSKFPLEQQGISSTNWQRFQQLNPVPTESKPLSFQNANKPQISHPPSNINCLLTNMSSLLEVTDKDSNSSSVKSNTNSFIETFSKIPSSQKIDLQNNLNQAIDCNEDSSPQFAQDRVRSSIGNHLNQGGAQVQYQPNSQNVNQNAFQNNKAPQFSLKQQNCQQYQGIEREIVFDKLTQLKEKVYSLLQKYQQELQNSPSRNKLKQQIKTDAVIISQSYSDIVNQHKSFMNTIDQYPINNQVKQKADDKPKEQEISIMRNLIEEFIMKFQTKGRKSQQQSSQKQNQQQQFQNSQQSIQQNNSSELHLNLNTLNNQQLINQIMAESNNKQQEKVKRSTNTQETNQLEQQKQKWQQEQEQQEDGKLETRISIKSHRSSISGASTIQQIQDQINYPQTNQSEGSMFIQNNFKIQTPRDIESPFTEILHEQSQQQQQKRPINSGSNPLMDQQQLPNNQLQLIKQKYQHLSRQPSKDSQTLINPYGLQQQRDSLQIEDYQSQPIKSLKQSQQQETLSIDFLCPKCEKYIKSDQFLNHSYICTQQMQKSNNQQMITQQTNSSLSHVNDTFYRAEDQETIQKKLDQKITKLKNNLTDVLTQAQMPMTKQILSEAIENLNQILQTKDGNIIKTVIQKLEKSINNLNRNTSSSYNIFLYLNDIVDVIKQKDQAVIDSTQIQLDKIRDLNSTQSPIWQKQITEFPTSLTPPLTIPNSFFQQRNSQQIAQQLQNDSLRSKVDEIMAQHRKPKTPSIEQDILNPPASIYQNTPTASISTKNYFANSVGPSAQIPIQNYLKTETNSPQKRDEIYFNNKYQQLQQSEQINYLKKTDTLSTPSQRLQTLSSQNDYNQQGIPRLSNQIYDMKINFYEKANQYKKKLPSNHPKQSLLISDLYDQILRNNIKPENWDQYLFEQFI